LILTLCNAETSERVIGSDRMSELSEMNEMKKIMVRVGYIGDLDETKPVRFAGRELCTLSNYSHQGENQNRWHEWTLYEVKNGYRVYDEFHSNWENESRYHKLSDVLRPKEVSEQYPGIANDWFELEDIAEDLD